VSEGTRLFDRKDIQTMNVPLNVMLSSISNIESEMVGQESFPDTRRSCLRSSSLGSDPSDLETASGDVSHSLLTDMSSSSVPGCSEVFVDDGMARMSSGISRILKWV
jgi:hypothetical protein